MARATKAERKRRRVAALVKISEGYGFADTVTFVMSEWGCSRSTARRDCHWAHGELQLGLDAHDVQHLVTHLCTSLQRISLKAESDKQFASSVGGWRFALALRHLAEPTPRQSSHQGKAYWLRLRATARQHRVLTTTPCLGPSGPTQRGSSEGSIFS